MSKKIYSSTSNPKNALKLTTDLNICCGNDNHPASQCGYSVVFPNTGYDLLTAVMIDGTVFQPESPIMLGGTPTGYENAENFIKECLQSLGYEASDVEITTDGTVITINAYPQEAQFVKVTITNLASQTHYYFVQDCTFIEAPVFAFNDTDGGEDVDLGEVVVPLVTMRLWDNNSGTGSPLQTTITNSEGKATFKGLAKSTSYWVDFDNSIGAGASFEYPAIQYKKINVDADGVVTYDGASGWDSDNYYPLETPIA